MTRVLLVLPSPPLPFGSAAARWFHVLLSGLAERGVETHAICCTGGEAADAEAAALHGDHASLTFFSPVTTRAFGKLTSWKRPYSYPYSPRMRAEVARLLQQRWDCVRFETHFSAWAADRLQAEPELNVHQLYSIDLKDDPPKALSQRLLRSRVLRSERALLRRFKRVSALTDRLAGEIGRLHPAAEVRVTPMTVDPSLYPFEPPPPLREPPTIGLIGTFRWGPTLSAARTLLSEVWPETRRRFATTKLLLVGRGAADAFPQQLTPDGVEVHSDVDDVLPYFRRLDALVYLPSIGSGMKVKVAEAIALGTPVITNREGAEGLPDQITQRITAPTTAGAIEMLTRLLQQKKTYDAAEMRDGLFARLSPDACVERVLAERPGAGVSRRALGSSC